MKDPETHRSSEPGRSDGEAAERCPPYEKEPTVLDVQEAKAIPDRSSVQQFKEALFRSDEIQSCRLLITESSWSSWMNGPGERQNQSSSPSLVWPLAVLADVPDDYLESEDDPPRWQHELGDIFRHHLFIRDLPFEELAEMCGQSPPYLSFAIACLADATSAPSMSQSVPTALKYFILGMKLYIATMELDNRETRLVESVLASALLSTYGLLSTAEGSWYQLSALLSYSITILRRLGFLAKASPTGRITLTLRQQSGLVSYKFLIDTMHAIHCNTIPNLSAAELNIPLPVSGHFFPAVYSKLLGEDIAPLPENLKAPEDATLLLTAILSDILFMQRTKPPRELLQTQGTSPAGDVAAFGMVDNPYAALSPSIESSRHIYRFRDALDRWLEHFGSVVSQDILAYYYFCRLCLVSPDIWRLPLLARYRNGPMENAVFSPDSMSMPDNPDTSIEAGEGMEFAWLVLNNVTISNTEHDRPCCIIWFPIVLFFSALTVWWQVRHRRSASISKHLWTLKSLISFSRELDKLPWPCCAVMSQTLEGLATEDV